MFNKLIDTFKMFFLSKKFEFLDYKVNGSKTKTKSAFILAPYMPPFTNGGVFRPMSWAKYAGENNWDVTFLTKKYNNEMISEAGNYLLSQVPNYIKVYPISGGFIEPAWRLIPKVDGSFLCALEAVKIGLSLMQEEKPSVIVATGPSFDFFIAGFLLSKASGVPLVIDYRDEWTENPFSFVKVGASDLLWEKKIFKHAKKIIFTTPAMMNHQSLVFKRKDGLDVVYNGWEEDELTSLFKESSHVSVSSDIELLYAGVLGEHSDPSGFFDAVLKCSKEIVSKISITIMGDINPKCSEIIEKYSKFIRIIIKEPVNRRESIKIMRTFDYLLLFSNKSMSRYIPGKLFDYASSGVPILGFGVDGEISENIKRGKLGFFCNETETKTLEKILKGSFLNEYKGNFLDRKKWLESKTRKAQARILFDLLEENSGDFI